MIELAEAFRGPPVQLTEGVRDKHILKAVFVAGAGGAGKSAVAKEMFGGTGMKPINADTHLERLLKQANVPLGKAGQQYGVFNQARDLRNVELGHYGRRRLGLVIDSTGWAYDRIAKPFHRLQKLGYDCYMVVVQTSLKTAHRRNAARAATGGRDVPASFIDDAWYGLEKNIGRYKKLFGRRRFITVQNDRDRTPTEFQKVLVPALRKIARRILKAPITNRTGKKWVEAGEKAQHGLDTPPPKRPAKPKISEPKRSKAQRGGLSRVFVPAAGGGHREIPVQGVGRAKTRFNTRLKPSRAPGDRSRGWIKRLFKGASTDKDSDLRLSEAFATDGRA